MLSHIDDFYLQATWIHVYTDGSATDAVQDGGAGSLIYLPNGHQTLEAASATGKYCTNYDAEVKALEQGAQAVIDLTDTNSEDVVFLIDFRSVLDSLAGHGEHNLSCKLYNILEHRRVILQWIPALCGIKDKEHADRLAKQGANMEQEKLPITLKQKKTIKKNMFRAKKIPDDYHTLDRAGRVTLIYWSQQTQFTHAQKYESSTITTMYLWNRSSNNRTYTVKMSSIPTSQTTDMVRRNII